MNTNINPIPGLPDIEELESMVKSFYGTLNHSDAFVYQDELSLEKNIDHVEVEHQTLDHYSSYIASLDKGQTPVSSIDSNAQHIGLGNLPQSLAGSGISPNAHQQGNAVDINNPLTSLPDPHFNNEPTSQTLGGSILKNENAGQALFYPHSFIGKGIGVLGAFSEYYFIQDLQYSEYAKGHHLEDLKNPRLSELEGKFNWFKIKKDFPILSERVNGKKLVWLDNAATTQKPKQVIDRIRYFYEHENSNIHRAAHELAARSTDAYEGAREKVRGFINARSINEIIFVRGTTEGINLIAKSWGEQFLNPGDEIMVSHLEHHANIVPWQQLAEKNKLVLKVIPVDDHGQVLLDEYQKLLSPKTKLVSITQVSNALGTVTPVKRVIELAHHAGAKVLVDGAQSVSHMKVDVQALDADFFVFSGHKVFGPTGIGAVYGKEDLLNETHPWQGGGNMIKDVTFEKTLYHQAPHRFEAGTGNIADAVGLGAAIDYVNGIGIELISQYEHYLLEYATVLLSGIKGLKLIGTAPEKASVLSFILEGYSNDDVGKYLNQEGIAVRTGHHCAQPILRRFGLESCVRPSLAFYNTCEDVHRLVNALSKLTSS